MTRGRQGRGDRTRAAAPEPRWRTTPGSSGSAAAGARAWSPSRRPSMAGHNRPQDQPKRSHAEATGIPTITGGDDRRLSGDIKLDGAPWVSWRKHPQLA